MAAIFRGARRAHKPVLALTATQGDRYIAG
jgi:hypothetical protein